MNTPPPRRFDADALVALASNAADAAPCEDCDPLGRPGWESMPGSVERRLLLPVGTMD